MADATRSRKMNEEIKNQIEALIKPNLNEILLKIDNITAKFEEKFQAQEERIALLESALTLRQNTVDVLLEELTNKCDENEQYSRRSCIRIHGIEDNDNNVEDIVVDCFKKVNLNIGKESIDRAHRIGNSYDDIQGSNKKVKSIIVKFKSWRERSALYQARPKLYRNGVKKSEKMPFTVSLDLTKKRYSLLKDAREVVKENPKVHYVCADINCSLVLKDRNNKFHYFNNEGGLNKILNSI